MLIAYQVALYDGDRFVAVAVANEVQRHDGITRVKVDLAPIGDIHIAPPRLEQCPFGLSNAKPPRHQPTKAKP